MRSTTIICTGYARLPEGMAAKNLYGVMGIGFEIDSETDRIINVSSTFVTSMCSDFLQSIFVGHDMKLGLEEQIEQFENRYFALGKKAVSVAIRDAHNQFLIYKNKIKVDS
ncbi:DUF3870 domain-containing protein [Bacillus ndiopicus]|uniref:DUF3870 domain-containing protein n=1 Tax=Bacillus ndiopicus TaxID=1347368 RepID=UPI0005A812A6|nr:DUF3870 domain-containing protein [Bacillus ndiopicus]